MVIMQNKETNETKRVLKTFHIGNFLGFPIVAVIVLLMVSKIMSQTAGVGVVLLLLVIGLLYVWEKVSYNDKKQIVQLKDAGFVEGEDTVGLKINQLKTKTEQYIVIAIVIAIAYFIISNTW